MDWYIEGVAFGNCSCVYGCPCQFEGTPTGGFGQFDILRHSGTGAVR